MKDSEFLMWLRDRLEFVYNENPLTDFVIKVKNMAHEALLKEAPQPPADVPLMTIAEIKEAHLGLRSDQDEYWISFARAVEAEVRRRMGVER